MLIPKPRENAIVEYLDYNQNHKKTRETAHEQSPLAVQE